MIKRSRLTSLDDAAIIVIDPLFDTRVSLSFLLSENYSEVFNVPYTHGLSKDELIECLRALRREGIVEVRDTQPFPTFELTSKGGQLWESERNPMWDLYCDVAECPQEGGSVRVEVSVASLELGARVLEMARECCLNEPIDMGRINWEPVRKPAIYWKPALQMWGATIVNMSERDLTEFYQQKMWWNTISDLNRVAAPL